MPERVAVEEGGAWGLTGASAYLPIDALPFAIKEKLHFPFAYSICGQM